MTHDSALEKRTIDDHNCQILKQVQNDSNFWSKF